MQKAAQLELLFVQFNLARLDLGVIENIVDDAQQRMGRVVDQRHILALLGGELSIQAELGHAENAVHRRADFVAHIGKKNTLRLVRGPRGGQRLQRKLLRLFAFGDVL